ncbi:MAG: hypothetical protein COA78_21960 [Blastopirellula sp.]|nr:MAG: hypothetical protein COA78_21960 [Blastopirellula sp.]
MADVGDKFYKLSLFKEWFEDYQSVKVQEIEEKKIAFEYYSGNQWTSAELEQLKKRNQPPSVHNVIQPKIRDLKGINIESKQEPAAFARTDNHEQDADTWSSLLKYVADKEDIDDKFNRSFNDMLIGGYEAMKFTIVKKTNRLKNEVRDEIRVNYIPHYEFFYDPTSMDHDFSDADYKGEYKWMKLTKAQQLYGDKFDTTGSSQSIGDGTLTEEQQPVEKIWNNTNDNRIRIVEMWYKRPSGWWFVLFWGGGIIRHVKSPYLDEHGVPMDPYSAMSDEIDPDGDRYGEVRAMISPQDGINQRRSKMLHQLSVRQFLYSEGAIEDVNKTKMELAKSDGAVKVNGDVNKEFNLLTQTDQIQGQAALLQQDIDHIEQIGANQALLGRAGANASGKAIRAQQNAGLVQLSSVFRNHKRFKLNSYRKIWLLITQFYTDERVFRITDDPKTQKFITINGVGIDEQGQPTAENRISDIDLDIKIEESPSAMTQQLEDFDSLIALMPAIANMPRDDPMFKLLVELSNISEAKKQIILNGEELSPEQQQARAKDSQDKKEKSEAFELMDLQGKDADNKKTIAETENINAETTGMAIEAGIKSTGVEP